MRKQTLAAVEMLVDHREAVESAIDQLMEKADEVPEGAVTAVEYGERLGISEKTIACRFRSLVAAKLMKTGRAWRKDKRGRQVLMNVYWVEEK